jgi:hypothetical protein
LPTAVAITFEIQSSEGREATIGLDSGIGNGTDLRECLQHYEENPYDVKKTSRDGYGASVYCPRPEEKEK